MQKLSIITINKNNAAGLEKTMQSVICQTYTDFEYIIIDGASDDESIEKIKKYSDIIQYWVSEPDTGIYNAMNKGIRKAQGDYCLFLNSGDYLVSPETLDNAFKEISNNPADIYYSDVMLSDGRLKQFPDTWTANYLFQAHINHQNSFIKRSLFYEHGFYNENLKIASDWEFFLNELWRYKSTFFHIKTNISIYDRQGISSRNKEILRMEDLIVLKNVFQELAGIIIQYRDFRKTIYYDIIENHYDTKFLRFLLKVYRKVFRIARRIIPFKEKHRPL